MLARAIVHVTACRPTKKGAYFLKSVRIERRQRFRLTEILELWTSMQVSDICAVQGQSLIMHFYAKCA